MMIKMKIDEDRDAARRLALFWFSVRTRWRELNLFLSEKGITPTNISRLSNSIDTIDICMTIAASYEKVPLSKLVEIYFPKNVESELLGDFESTLEKKAYDKIRAATKVLVDNQLIIKTREHRTVFYEPSEILLEFMSRKY